MTTNLNPPVQDIPVKAIKINPEFNARLKYEGIDELAAQIKKDGLLQNIVIRPIPDKEGVYHIVAGHRRYLAVSKLEWETIPAIVREYEGEPDAIFANLSENVSRRTLTGYELAVKCYDLQATYKISGAVIASRLQELSRGYVNNLLRIIENVNPTIVDAWKKENKVATIDFLVTLAKYKDHEEQLKLWKNAVKARKVDADREPDEGEDGEGGDEGGSNGKKKSKKGEEVVQTRIKRPAHEVVQALIDNIRELDKSGALHRLLKKEDIGDFAIACLKFSLGRPKKVKVGDFFYDPAAPDEEESEAGE